MNIEISGNHCVGCDRYTQYYKLDYKGEYVPINRGFCGVHQRTTKPGNRCKKWMDAGWVMRFDKKND